MTQPHQKMTIGMLKIVLGSMCAGMFLFACLTLYMDFGMGLGALLENKQDSAQIAPDDASSETAILVVSESENNKQDVGMILLIVLGAVTVSAATASIVLKKVFWGYFQKQHWPEPLTEEGVEGILKIYTKYAIATSALVEGVCLFATILYMLLGHVWLLGILVAGIVVILSKFPSEEKFNSIAQEANQASGLTG